MAGEIPIVDSDSQKAAMDQFRRHGGMLRMAEAIRAGIHRRTLYALLDAGALEQLSRGLYRLYDAQPLRNPDLVTVALRVPKGVICLISALAFHEMTTQIPHEIYVAVSRDSEPPRMDHPASFEVGIETQSIDGIPVRIYSREKTLADCFKYRNKVGMDTTLEAVRLYRRQGRVDAKALMGFAEVCRVSRVMRPYLEALL